MAPAKCELTAVKWPDKTEYVDKYILPDLMPAKSDPWSTSKSKDAFSGRPRTPNDPYSCMNVQQLKNLKKDATPLFFHEDPSTKGCVRLPTAIDRFAFDTSQYLFRDTPPRSQPHCWIGEKWQREVTEQHNTSRLGASLPWGPTTAGARTCRHSQGEDVFRYLNIDVYRRPPTNKTSTVVMKYGRPSEGYYEQRNPSFDTWFRSSHLLNETNVLTHIQPKSFAEYEQFHNVEQNYGKFKASKWPEVSEYTDKYLLRTKDELQMDKFEARKMFHKERKRLEAETLLRSKTEQAAAEACMDPAVLSQTSPFATDLQPLAA